MTFILIEYEYPSQEHLSLYKKQNSALQIVHFYFLFCSAAFFSKTLTVVGWVSSHPRRSSICQVGCYRLRGTQFGFGWRLVIGIPRFCAAAIVCPKDRNLALFCPVLLEGWWAANDCVWFVTLWEVFVWFNTLDVGGCVALAYIWLSGSIKIVIKVIIK